GGGRRWSRRRPWPRRPRGGVGGSSDPASLGGGGGGQTTGAVPLRVTPVTSSVHPGARPAAAASPCHHRRSVGLRRPVRAMVATAALVVVVVVGGVVVGACGGGSGTGSAAPAAPVAITCPDESA